MRVLPILSSLLVLGAHAFAGPGPDPDKSGAGRDGRARAQVSERAHLPPKDPLDVAPGFLTDRQAGYVEPVPGVPDAPDCGVCEAVDTPDGTGSELQDLLAPDI